MPGRPQKARRKGENEEKKQGHNVYTVSRGGRVMKCSNCQQSGHNKKGCKNPTMPAQQKQPVERQARTTGGVSKQSNERHVKKTKASTSKSIRDQVPNGFGIYISPQSGNTYFKGSGFPIQLNGEGGSQVTDQNSQATPNLGNTKTTFPSQNTRTSKFTAGIMLKKTLGVKRKIIK